MNKYTFFWGWDHVNGYLSNFYYAPYYASGIRFNTSEQEFMYRKAIFFDDHEIATKILISKTPKQAKDLGRRVKNFNEKEWDKARYGIMFKCLYNKFTYANNKHLRDRLTEGKQIFVEASPYDKIWGIGMKETDPRATDNTQWNGMNLLGEALSNLSRELKN